MSSSQSHNLLSYLNQNFPQAFLVNYEQVNLNDKFGDIMLSNMELRACKLLGVDVCHSIDTQIDRFVQAGFSKQLCKVITMSDYYGRIMDFRERDRIEHIEFLDESELLFQLMDHYCVCSVTNSSALKELLF
jgi:[phosphatase 2A protein]-leucine-carboxy methyltransferase